MQGQIRLSRCTNHGFAWDLCVLHLPFLVAEPDLREFAHIPNRQQNWWAGLLLWRCPPAREVVPSQGRDWSSWDTEKHGSVLLMLPRSFSSLLQTHPLLAGLPAPASRPASCLELNSLQGKSLKKNWRYKKRLFSLIDCGVERLEVKLRFWLQVLWSFCRSCGWLSPSVLAPAQVWECRSAALSPVASVQRALWCCPVRLGRSALWWSAALVCAAVRQWDLLCIVW